MATYPAQPVPNYEHQEAIEFPVAVTRYPNGTEQRILTSAQGGRRFSLVYKSIAPADIDVLWDFYIARKGKHESFNYVSSRDGVTYVVRFDMESMSRELFAYNLERTGVKLIEVFGESPAP